MSGCLVWLVGVFLMVTSQAFAALGIEAPVGEIGTEIWGTWIPVVLAVLGAVGAFVAWILNHQMLFLTLLVLAVLIFAIGVGIPEMMGQANLNFVF